VCGKTTASVMDPEVTVITAHSWVICLDSPGTDAARELAFPGAWVFFNVARSK